MTERIINKNEPEYFKLQIVALALETASRHYAEYKVEDIYLDYGQNWKWTTIVRRGYRACQVLSPRQWKEIMEAETVTELKAIVEEIRNGEYFGDK